MLKSIQIFTLINFMVREEITNFLKGKKYINIIKLPNTLQRRDREYYTALDKHNNKVFIKYRKDVEYLQNEHDTLLFLEEKNLGHFVPKSHGLYKIDSGYLLIVDFLEGTVLSKESYGINDDYNEYVDKLPGFVKSDKQFSPLEVPFLDIKDTSFFRGKIEQYSKLIASQHPDLTEVLENIKQLTCEEISLHLQHGDFFNINIYLDSDKNLKILDWEFACLSSRFLDLAMIVNKNYLNQKFVRLLIENMDEFLGAQPNQEFNLVLGYLILKELKILIEVGDQLSSIPHLHQYYLLMQKKIRLFSIMLSKKLPPTEIIQSLLG